MIRVGFVIDFPNEWIGGLNYFKNLLYAINKYQKRNIEVYVFLSKNFDDHEKRIFQQYATVIEDTIFNRRSFRWYVNKIFNKFFKSNYYLEQLFKKYDIDILSHSQLVNFKSIKTINWIPDFQHIHLENMFSSDEINSRNKNFRNLIENSEKIVLSSYDAFYDYKKFAPDYIKKAEVLQFVSQPKATYFNMDEEDFRLIKRKYNIDRPYFYLPNQLWKHKNHLLVFEAIKLLIKDGFNILIICSGSLEDYRDKNYYHEIKKYITKNDLGNYIKLLGLIDYKDVFLLMKFSIAVINPSLFEGWSSTVEECKSIGKNMILSDISVHKEQYPEATFFDCHNAIELKQVLANYDCEIEIKFNQNILDERTKKFAKTYYEIIRKII
ncbi:glycosyltransferase [Francisella philomiragia]|uniref:Glycosyltransferase n=2 Tax=Francisella TaxID=262 RepID=A0ABS1GBR9_9GAMM|nr:glycosyltransferase [Francisella philomiragia]MBK2258609.1 glycosyltransferase [Francisella philomiragia]MBK2302221.1 glycosyltransferase [Francisella philomiragia]